MRGRPRPRERRWPPALLLESSVLYSYGRGVHVSAPTRFDPLSFRSRRLFAPLSFRSRRLVSEEKSYPSHPCHFEPRCFLSGEKSYQSRHKISRRYAPRNDKIPGSLSFRTRRLLSGEKSYPSRHCHFDPDVFYRERNPISADIRFLVAMLLEMTEYQDLVISIPMLSIGREILPKPHCHFDPDAFYRERNPTRAPIRFLVVPVAFVGPRTGTPRNDMKCL